MKQQIYVLLLIALLSSGCASIAVRSLGHTEVYEGPSVIMVWTNGVVGIKDVRFKSLKSHSHGTIITQRYYRVSQSNIYHQAKGSTQPKPVQLDYSKYQIFSPDHLIPILDNAESTPDVLRVYRLGGYGGVRTVEYFEDIYFSIGKAGQSQQVAEYRATWGKVLQPLMIIAVPFDIVTSPIQAVVIAIFVLPRIGFPSS
jgi:hypothetical protein